jgi:putative two-component system response regulator
MIMLTALTDEELKPVALDLGATDLLNKPVKREDLLARIRSVLRLKAYQDELETLNETLERRVVERTADLEESRLNMVWRLAKAGEYRDEATGNHVVRVGCYCRALAEELGMPRSSTEILFLTAPLHDIGKIGVPDSILRKPGKLTEEEQKIMQLHCVIGADILLREPRGMREFLEWLSVGRRDGVPQHTNRLLEVASSIALGHHERWDGMGYPQGLKGDGIPLEARITALADVYDALCSVRPYKPAYPEPQVLSILKEEARNHFDPGVYAAFEKCAGEFSSIRTEFPDATCPVPETSETGL